MNENMNTIYFTRTCKRRQRLGDTLVIRTDDATITITAGKRTQVTTMHDTPKAAPKAEPKVTNEATVATAHRGLPRVSGTVSLAAMRAKYGH
jgi:hypothetical protein